MYRNNRMEKMAEIEKVIFMNMCMVYDHAGRVLALDKVGKAIPERHSWWTCGTRRDIHRIGDTRDI